MDSSNPALRVAVFALSVATVIALFGLVAVVLIG